MVIVRRVRVMIRRVGMVCIVSFSLGLGWLLLVVGFMLLCFGRTGGEETIASLGGR